MKFSRLLFRYLCHTNGVEEAKEVFGKYISMLGNLREMSDIMKNKAIKIVPFPTLETAMNTHIDMKLFMKHAEEGAGSTAQCSKSVNRGGHK